MYFARGFWQSLLNFCLPLSFVCEMKGGIYFLPLSLSLKVAEDESLLYFSVAAQLQLPPHPTPSPSKKPTVTCSGAQAFVLILKHINSTVSSRLVRLILRLLKSGKVTGTHTIIRIAEKLQLATPSCTPGQCADSTKYEKGRFKRIIDGH